MERLLPLAIEQALVWRKCASEFCDKKWRCLPGSKNFHCSQFCKEDEVRANGGSVLRYRTELAMERVKKEKGESGFVAETGWATLATLAPDLGYATPVSLAMKCKRLGVAGRKVRGSNAFIYNVEQVRQVVGPNPGVGKRERP